jgi:hypothetical protein
MLPLYVSRQSVHGLFVILAQGLMFQYGNCTGIVLNRHRADGLGVWAISGDDMLEALKHIEEVNCEY